ncbi:MAG: hypothetical protein OEW35_08340 [Gammaproteobacteria bacterium]|nr:hypothetical protein [Gammaproteobacteria bacterium]MDH4255461.1 hypothetical protein [Gammaproteobacteria bacterium]MDH5309283.1 hypothetical protein [Gammaproteobacteria bacterium]
MDRTRPCPEKILHASCRAGIALLFACAGAHATDRQHEYRVAVDAGLARLEAEARFAGPQRRLLARSPLAATVLIDAATCDGRPLRIGGRRIELPDSSFDCLRYTVDLARAAREERRNRGLAPGNRIVAPSVWLWRPDLGAETTLRLRFDLPDGLRVALPWPRDPGNADAYLLARTPESADAPAVFGAFDQHVLEVPGARLRVSLLRAEPALDSASILAWLVATATDVTLAYGRFPNPAPQVVVIPVGAARGGKSAVPFGRVARDGGEIVELFVDQRRALADYLADWTATHEFSHLMLPYLGSSDRWISEGFAQYYQNVLLARAGGYQPLEAWQKIHAGLERGRQSRPELSPNAAAAGGKRAALMKVYWSGAALALLADVELRARTGGELSLDVALAGLQSCCLPSSEIWSGPELFRTLDSLLGVPVLLPLYEAHADAPGFPELDPVFGRLGIDVVDGRVVLRDEAELAWLRDAITARNPAATYRDRLQAGPPDDPP